MKRNKEYSPLDSEIENDDVRNDECLFDQIRKFIIMAAVVIITISVALVVVLFYVFSQSYNEPLRDLPIVINTWDFKGANVRAWQTFVENGTAIDAVEKGCNHCEDYPEQCRYSVGYGGNPNELGETTLDAMIMYGPTHDAGAVGCMKRVKNAISVARRVMEETLHTLLVGDDATNFAVQMKFPTQDLQTNRSYEVWKNWTKTHVPNFWTKPHNWSYVGNMEDNHDTIGMIAVDINGNICVGTSTNGLAFKIPGRIGDSPIPGAGAYVDNDVGGAVATGDGDVLMRFLPTYQAVEYMRQGMSPTDAARNSVSKIPRFYNKSRGAIIAVNKYGVYGAAVFGTYSVFPFWVRTSAMSDSELKTVVPV